MNIGESIKELRIKNNMTQKTLANIADLSEISIRKYEANERIPKINTVKKIADALNVTIGDLDPEYTYYINDRNNATNLIMQLEHFIEELPKMSATEENKQKNLNEATDLLEKAKVLAGMVDFTISRDKEMKEVLDEKKELIGDIQEKLREIDEMFLSVIHRLNAEGREKAIAYTVDLSKIPEYQKDKEYESLTKNLVDDQKDEE